MAPLSRPKPASLARLQRRRTVFAGLLAAALVASPWRGGRAQDATRAAEYKVKAAFLYKFASYVEWPPQVFDGPASPLVIGVVDSDNLSDELAEVVAGRTVGGRPVTVRKLARLEPAGAMHIAFIGSPGSVHFTDLLTSLKGRPV